MAFIPTTKNGYILSELASALQKDIRRSNERNALFWAYEMEISNFGAYLWKRLTIIAIEDVGPADNEAIVRITALKTAYEELRKKKSKETNLAVAAAVIYLSRCDKSRLYDWCKCYMVDFHETKHPAIPEYALDMHTRRGRQRGKTIRDFFEDGCKLHPHSPAPDEEQYMAEMRERYYSRATSAPQTDPSPAEIETEDDSKNKQGNLFET